MIIPRKFPRKLEPIKQDVGVFLHLNQELLKGFYYLFEEDHQIQRWKGHRLIALDGSYINLPSSLPRYYPSEI